MDIQLLRLMQSLTGLVTTRNPNPDDRLPCGKQGKRCIPSVTNNINNNCRTPRIMACNPARREGYKLESEFGVGTVTHRTYIPGSERQIQALTTWATEHKVHSVRFGQSVNIARAN